MILLLLVQLWFTIPSTDEVLIQGNWQTCDGEERAYEHWSYGKHLWTLHLGPRNDFALYAGGGEYGEEHSHDSTLNLLAPQHRIEYDETHRAKLLKDIPTLGLTVEIVKGEDWVCQQFYVKISKMVEGAK